MSKTHHRVTIPCLLAALALLPTLAARADVTANSLFGDNAVLPRDIPLPVWGTAAEGENVTVELDGKSASNVTKDGYWKAVLPSHPAGGPYTLTIHGANNTLTLRNILLGDVWIASGQSNMERQLGPRPPQPPIDDWQQEVAVADHPQIRQYYVPKVATLTPATDVASHWTVCSPQTAADFTAVGYFFARDLHKATGVPIGIIFSALGRHPGGTLDQRRRAQDPARFRRPRPTHGSHGTRGRGGPAGTAGAVFRGERPGVRALAMVGTRPTSTRVPGPRPPARRTTSTSTPTPSRASSGPGVNSTCPRRGRAARRFCTWGQVDDNDTAFVNGVAVGSTEGWNLVRSYKVSPNLLKVGRNVIAVRIVNTGGGGGFVTGTGKPFSLEMTPARNATVEPPVSLAGGWRYQTTTPLAKLPQLPSLHPVGPGDASVLFNGMIAPFLPLPTKGVVWYQGESNVDHPDLYRTLFPTMIADWRQHWGIGDFPFLFVQVAPYKGTTPDIREAQFLSLKAAPNTAMVVTADVGDGGNIHPSHKAPVGARLALAARALAYHEDIEYSGPLYQSASFAGGRATVRFDHAKSGLVAKDGPLRGFTIAGENGNFVPAQAAIQSDAGGGFQRDGAAPGRRALWLGQRPGREPLQRRGPARVAVPHG